MTENTPIQRAFPSGDGPYGGGPNHDYGMTLRDYFAAQVISTMIHKTEDQDGGWDPVAVAVGAYLVADAMLAHRQSTSHLARAEDD